MSISKVDKKKNGLQGYRVRIRYTTPLGEVKQVERMAYGKQEATAMEIKLLTEYGSELPSVKMTLEALIAEYMRAIKPEIRETSFKKKETIFRLYIIPQLGKYKLDALTVPVLQRWKSEMNELGKSLSTRKHIYTEISAALNHAVRCGYMPLNPLSKVGNFKDASFVGKQDALHYYTAEEYHAFSSAAKEMAERSNSLFDWSFYVFFSVAFYTGMRKGEINALKWTDIEGSIIHVRRSIAQKLKGGDRETPPKNKSSYRDLQMPKPLIRILAEHKARQQADSRFTEDWRVCGGESCLRDTTIEKRNQAYAAAAGLPHIRIHDFRHTHATLLANEGINIQEIARRLGHSNVEQTWNTYSHLYPREEERAVAILDSLRFDEDSLRLNEDSLRFDE